MNQLVIVFLPAGATQPDFETALRERFAALHAGKTVPETKIARVEITDNDQLPLWTWFISNPSW